MMVISVFHKHFPIPVHVFKAKQSTNGSFLSVATPLVVIGLVSAVTRVTTGLVKVVTVVTTGLVIGRTMVNAVVVVALVRAVILVVRKMTGRVMGVVSLHTVFRVPLRRCVKVLKIIVTGVSGFLAGT